MELAISRSVAALDHTEETVFPCNQRKREETESKQVCFLPFHYHPLQLHAEEQQAESSVVLRFFNLNSSFL